MFFSQVSLGLAHRLRVLGLCVALVLPLMPAQAQLSRQRLPNLGDGADVPLGVERRLGESIAREIYRDPDYLDDPVLGDYLQSIWQTLLATARQRGELTPELEQQFAWDIWLILYVPFLYFRCRKQAVAHHATCKRAATWRGIRSALKRLHEAALLRLRRKLRRNRRKNRGKSRRSCWCSGAVLSLHG